MATLTKNTMWSMSLATMLTFVGAIWMASGFIQNQLGMIEANASGVSYLSQKRIQDIIRGLKRDKRELEAELRHDPNNDYIKRDISATQDDIDFYSDILKCMRDGHKDCE